MADPSHGPDDALLQKAVDDRERHPWRYYKLDHDVMKRLLDQLSERADTALARAQALEADLDKLADRGTLQALKDANDRAEAAEARVQELEQENEEQNSQLNDLTAELEAAEQAQARLREENDALKSKLDSTDDEGVRYSFAALCDSIDSKFTEGQLYDWGIWHIRRLQKAEAESCTLREALRTLLEKWDKRRTGYAQRAKEKAYYADELAATEIGFCADDLDALLAAEGREPQAQKADARVDRTAGGER